MVVAEFRVNDRVRIVEDRSTGHQGELGIVAKLGADPDPVFEVRLDKGGYFLFDRHELAHHRQLGWLNRLKFRGAEIGEVIRENGGGPGRVQLRFKNGATQWYKSSDVTLVTESELAAMFHPHYINSSTKLTDREDITSTFSFVVDSEKLLAKQLEKARLDERLKIQKAVRAQADLLRSLVGYDLSPLESAGIEGNAKIIDVIADTIGLLA